MGTSFEFWLLIVIHIVLLFFFRWQSNKARRKAEATTAKHIIENEQLKGQVIFYQNENERLISELAKLQ